MGDAAGGLGRREPVHVHDALGIRRVKLGDALRRAHEVQVHGLEAGRAIRGEEAVANGAQVALHLQLQHRADLLLHLTHSRLCRGLPRLQLALGHLPGGAVPPLAANQQDLWSLRPPEDGHTASRGLMGEAIAEVEDVSEGDVGDLPQALAVAIEVAAGAARAADVDVEHNGLIGASVCNAPGLALRAGEVDRAAASDLELPTLPQPLDAAGGGGVVQDVRRARPLTTRLGTASSPSPSPT